MIAKVAAPGKVTRGLFGAWALQAHGRELVSRPAQSKLNDDIDQAPCYGRAGRKRRFLPGEVLFESRSIMAVDLTKCFVHFGLPCYGGQFTEPFFTSFVRFVLAAARVELKWAVDTQPNDSLVTRARNNLMAKMLANQHATHFMFIDADIRFEPDSILNMLAADKDVIGGLYPLKKLPISYVVNARPGSQASGDLREVDTIGTGFLLMKRHAIERMVAAYPETKYVDDTDFGKQFEPYMYALFDCEIDERGHYLSEDWTFCRRWSRLGGKIFAHMKVLLNHVGRYEYAGDLRKLEPR